MMNRVWMPCPIVLPAESVALTSNVSFRPSIAVNTAFAVMVSPILDAFTWSTFICVPTVDSPSARDSWTSVKAAFSINAIIDGVENTSSPPEPTAEAQLAGATCVLHVYSDPIFILLDILYSVHAYIDSLFVHRNKTVVTWWK